MEGQLTIWQCFADMDREIKQKLEHISNNFIELGFLFKQARDGELYKEAGYSSVYEYVDKEYHITRTQALRFMQLNDQYSLEGNSKEIDPKYKGYGSSKLTEMLGIPEDIREEIPTDATVKEIREAKAFMNEPEAAAADNMLEQIVKERYQDPENIKELKALKKLKDWVADDVLAVIAPSKFKMWRHMGWQVMIKDTGFTIMASGNKTHYSFMDFMDLIPGIEEPKIEVNDSSKLVEKQDTEVKEPSKPENDELCQEEKSAKLVEKRDTEKNEEKSQETTNFDEGEDSSKLVENCNTEIENAESENPTNFAETEEIEKEEKNEEPKVENEEKTTNFPQNLNETTDMMLSEDWKERFKAEYYQTKIRHEKLEKMLFDWDNLSFEPKCPKELLKKQFETMNQLLDIYEERAKIEEIAL